MLVVSFPTFHYRQERTRCKLSGPAGSSPLAFVPGTAVAHSDPRRRAAEMVKIQMGSGRGP